MHDVHLDRLEHFARIRKARRNAEALRKLLRHQQFRIAGSDYLGMANSPYLESVLVGHLAATDYGNPDHPRLTSAPLA